ncbi:hypothetical protein MAR_019680 [Mya arenaria]|uniref:Uncharacterized protein n=1 Tax=Mya arenaria TaxID=6604 RepID=A0ABY7E5T2_MYAAR|nr:hypothetical protein MAR_019680 [Mya arenaria]
MKKEDFVSYLYPRVAIGWIGGPGALKAPLDVNIRVKATPVRIIGDCEPGRRRQLPVRHAPGTRH